MSEKKNRENSRIIAQLVETEGKFGKMNSIAISNPHPLDKDGGENRYHKGSLIWLDKQTGKSFLIKSLKVVNTENKPFGKNGTSTGFVCVELDNTYQAEELNNN